MNQQATKKTRQQLREDSPSGIISMPRHMGKSKVVAAITGIFSRG